MPSVGATIGIIIGAVAAGLIFIDVQEANIRKLEQLDQGEVEE
ncbi:hypothetical protein [Terribacillus saccharophilus]